MKFQPKLAKMAKYGGPLFSPKNKCVLNDFIWPEMHFGTFFFFNFVHFFEGFPKALTFSMNFEKSNSTVQGDLDTLIFIQYASVIPFWKALDIHKCFLTSDVNRGHLEVAFSKKIKL